MSPRVVRLIVIVVNVIGIAGMIVGSIADNNGIAISFGLVTAVAALCLIVATATGGPDAFRAVPGFDPETAAELEQRIGDLVAEGADEPKVRDLVRLAVRLGARR